MNSVEIFIAIFLLTVFAAALASRINVIIEIVLLLISLTISLIPGLPSIEIKPELILTLLLPPILFSAAYNISWRDFKQRLRPIMLLAVGLVLFTTCAVAIVMKWLIPSLPWAVGFLLGAIVSPPDASASLAIAKKFGLPSHLLTIIEGESLINDATALITYRFALTAIAYGSFSLTQAGIEFIGVTLGGILVGIIICVIGCWGYKLLKAHNERNVLMLTIPFTCYIIAEQLHVSGVMATVTAGLLFTKHLPEVTDVHTRHKAEAIWENLIFILNGLIFTLIGFELPTVLKDLGSYSTRELVIYAAVCSLVVIVIRFIWVFSIARITRISRQRKSKTETMPSWKNLVILSWVGMRGIVSLAAALALPLVLPDGHIFPYRDLIIFITYVVILTTLLIPTLSLPALIALLNIKNDDKHQEEALMARLKSTQTAIKYLNDISKKNEYPAEILKQILQRYERRLTNLHSQMAEAPYSTLFTDEQHTRALNQTLIEIERKIILKLRSQGEISNKVFYHIQRELDLEDLHYKTQRL